VLVPITAAVRAVTAMTAVHEEVHEGTGEEQEIGHDAEHVRPVLGEQEEGRDRQESEQRQPGR
jgi:hypothetical protein